MRYFLIAGLLLWASWAQANPGLQEQIDALNERMNALEAPEGGTRVWALNEKLQLWGFLQMQYQFVEQGRTPGTGTKVNPVNSFSIRRGRLAINGILHDWVGYQLHFRSDNGAGVGLLDAVLNFTPWGKAHLIRVGQWIQPDLGDGPGRRLVMISRTNNGAIGLGTRDRGIGVEGLLLDKKLRYYAVLSNGSGTAGANDNAAMKVNGVLRFQPLGDLGIFVNDLSFSDPRFQVGFRASHSRDADSAIDSTDRNWLGTSFSFKAHGFFAKFHLVHLDVLNDLGSFKDQRAVSFTTGKSLRLPWKSHIIEPVARFQVLDTNTSIAGSKQRWATAGLNYYLKGHDSKLMANYTLKREEAGSRIHNDTLEMMYQVQF